MDGETLAKAAAAWLGSLGQWPEEGVHEVIRQNFRAKTETPGYYGVAGVLLMLCAANDAKWPPMSPRTFAEGLSAPAMILQVERYARNVDVVESSPRGGGA